MVVKSTEENSALSAGITCNCIFDNEESGRAEGVSGNAGEIPDGGKTSMESI